MSKNDGPNMGVLIIVGVCILALTVSGILYFFMLQMQAAQAADQELVLEERTELDLAIAEVNETCYDSADLYDYYYDNSPCYAEEAAKMKKDGTAYSLEGNSDFDSVYKDNGVYFIDQVCKASDDEDFCYYYAAVINKDNSLCTKVEDTTGCRMLSDENYCKNTVDLNIPVCLSVRAYALSYIYPDRADALCEEIDRKYDMSVYEQMAAMDEDYEFEGCDDIDYSDTEFYDLDFMDRFQTMYFYMWISGYEIETKTVPR